MKTLFLILLILTSVPAYCSYRPILIKKELQEASFVGEIKFIGYDSTRVSRYSESYYAVAIDSLTGKEIRVHTKDSVWVISTIYFQKLGSDSIFSAEVRPLFSLVRYNSRPDTLPKERVSNGFCPKINDTCLMVLDSTQRISVFALIEDDQYIFWDPYYNTGWNSVFVFDDLFEFYPLFGTNSENHSVFRRCADFFKMKHASQFHCAITRSILWDQIVNESP